MTTQLQGNPTLRQAININPEGAHKRFRELMNRMPFHHQFEIYFDVEYLDQLWKNAHLAEFEGAGTEANPYRYLTAFRHTVRDGAGAIYYWTVIEIRAFLHKYTYRVTLLSPLNLPAPNTAIQAIMVIAETELGQTEGAFSEFQFTEYNSPYRTRYSFDGMQTSPVFGDLWLGNRFDNLTDVIENCCQPLPLQKKRKVR